MTESRMERIRSRLEQAFSPEQLEIFDDSHQHEGHAGAREGKGHFRVHIVSEKFKRTRPVARHRMVFTALGEMMETDIHALSVSAHPPDSSDSSD